MSRLNYHFASVACGLRKGVLFGVNERSSVRDYRKTIVIFHRHEPEAKIVLANVGNEHWTYVARKKSLTFSTTLLPSAVTTKS